MKIVLETERLRVREMTSADLESLVALDTDPEVMKSISDGKTLTPEVVQNILQRIIEHYEEWKVYGVWAAELKSTGEWIGWFALKPLPGTSEIEVGYRLLRKHWGNGYATEGTRALLRYGTEILGLKKIVAITHPKNQASKNVLEKSGLKPQGDGDYQSSPESAKIQVSWFSVMPNTSPSDPA